MLFIYDNLYPHQNIGLYSVIVIKYGFLNPPIDSFIYRSEGRASLERIRATALDLPAEIYRVKGFVRSDEGCVRLDVVRGRVGIEPAGDAGDTELVFIGPGIESVREATLEAFRGCEG